MVAVQIYLDEDKKQLAKGFAKKNGISFSQVIRDGLNEFLKRKSEEQNSKDGKRINYTHSTNN
jgi:hypothetical protein